MHCVNPYHYYAIDIYIFFFIIFIYIYIYLMYTWLYDDVPETNFSKMHLITCNDNALWALYFLNMIWGCPDFCDGFPRKVMPLHASPHSPWKGSTLLACGRVFWLKHCLLHMKMHIFEFPPSLFLQCKNDKSIREVRMDPSVSLSLSLST